MRRAAAEESTSVAGEPGKGAGTGVFDVDGSLVRLIGQAHAFDARERDRENRAVHALRLQPTGPNYRESALTERDTTPRVPVLDP